MEETTPFKLKYLYEPIIDLKGVSVLKKNLKAAVKIGAEISNKKKELQELEESLIENDIELFPENASYSWEDIIALANEAGVSEENVVNSLKEQKISKENFVEILKKYKELYQKENELDMSLNEDNSKAKLMTILELMFLSPAVHLATMIFLKTKQVLNENPNELTDGRFLFHSVAFLLFVLLNALRDKKNISD